MDEDEDIEQIRLKILKMEQTMSLKIDRKVIIHLILIGIIMMVVFLITLDLKKGEFDLDHVSPVYQEYDPFLDDLGF